MKLNSQSDKIIKSRLFFEFNVSVYLRTDCYLFKYMNWTSSIMFVQSQFSQVKLFFIKFDEIFLIKGIVIWKFGADISLSFPFVKKPSKIDLIIMSDIPFQNKRTQLKEHFKFYIHCLLKSCLVLRCINSEFIDTETTTLIQILHVSQVKWETFHNFRVS